jgi:hypothetical protein
MAGCIVDEGKLFNRFVAAAWSIAEMRKEQGD